MGLAELKTREATETDVNERLRQRLGERHLGLRLGIEQDEEARVFGRGRNFFHLENWYSVHGLIRNALRLCGLHGRGQRNARRIRIEDNHVAIPGLAAAFEGYRVLHLSDLHLDMADDFTHALIETVRGIDCDLCVLTGDYRARTFGPVDGALAALQRLRLHLDVPVYGVLGNHDSVQMLPAMEDMGIRMLLNEHVRIERNGALFALAGVDDPHYFRADNLEKAAEGIDPKTPAVLLAHSPELYRQAAHTGFQWMLSGHTHGGQICLPGGIPLWCNAACPRSLCAGAWSYNGMQGYTSRGSGASVVDVRFHCAPEVTVHHLHAG